MTTLELTLWLSALAYAAGRRRTGRRYLQDGSVLLRGYAPQGTA